MFGTLAAAVGSIVGTGDTVGPVGAAEAVGSMVVGVVVGASSSDSVGGTFGSLTPVVGTLVGTGDIVGLVGSGEMVGVIVVGATLGGDVLGMATGEGGVGPSFGTIFNVSQFDHCQC
jgi:hypothetical protein